MPPARTILASLFIVGALTASGVACSSSDDKSSAASISSWCTQFEEAETEEAGADLKDASAAFESLAENAPSEISDDMKMLVSALTAFENADMSDPAALEAAAADFDEAEMDAAADRIEAFVKDNCGFDLDED